MDLLVVFSLPLDQIQSIVDHLKLPYPIYADPDFTIFDTYGSGHILFGPKQAWFGIDAAGVIRHVWRSGDNGKTSRVPLPLEFLGEFERHLQ